MSEWVTSPGGHGRGVQLGKGMKDYRYPHSGEPRGMGWASPDAATPKGRGQAQGMGHLPWLLGKELGWKGLNTISSGCQGGEEHRSHFAGAVPRPSPCSAAGSPSPGTPSAW